MTIVDTFIFSLKRERAGLSWGVMLRALLTMTILLLFSIALCGSIVA